MANSDDRSESEHRDARLRDSGFGETIKLPNSMVTLDPGILAPPPSKKKLASYPPEYGRATTDEEYEQHARNRQG